MRSVCVFCGANPGRRPEYAAGAADLGRTLAARGIRVVYGGAHVGLMGALADAVLAADADGSDVVPGNPHQIMPPPDNKEI
jgi:predicted Rossmann-fold nucleotide-binding protein